MAVQLAVQLAVYQVASTLHPGTAEMARRTDEIARKSPNSLMVAVWQLFMEFTRGIRRRIPPRYTGKLVQWQYNAQWQYNGGNGSVMAVCVCNGSVMAVQLKVVFASYSHRIGTILHYIGTILALYWHSWVVMAVQYRPLRSRPSVRGDIVLLSPPSMCLHVGGS